MSLDNYLKIYDSQILTPLEMGRCVACFVAVDGAGDQEVFYCSFDALGPGGQPLRRMTQDDAKLLALWGQAMGRSMIEGSHFKPAVA